MKYLIASDIHGSALYCEKLLARMEAEKADTLLLLGDVLYHGPRNDLPEGYAPKQVIAMLNPLKEKIVCVRGNCEAEVDQMVLDFDVTTEHKTLTIHGKTILLTHGHHINIENPPAEKVDIVISGHTHVPLNEVKHGILYLNPGSTTIPKNGSPHAYMVYDGDSFVWKDLDGVPFTV